jgi:hypothetical protein
MRTGVTLSVTSAELDRLHALVKDSNGAEARMAGADRVAERRWRRHERDHARDRQIQDVRPALAGALRKRGREGPVARQDASLPRAETCLQRHRARRRIDDGAPGEVTHWTSAAMAKTVGAKARQQRCRRCEPRSVIDRVANLTKSCTNEDGSEYSPKPLHWRRRIMAPTSAANSYGQSFRCLHHCKSGEVG